MGLAQYDSHLPPAETAAMLATANVVGAIAVLDPLRHSHYPVGFGRFDKILLGPHRRHLRRTIRRDHWDKNLGDKLSIWDWMFGAAFQPEKGEVIDFGVGTIEDARRDYRRAVGCYVGRIVKNDQMLQCWARGQSFTAEDKARLYTERSDRGRPPSSMA